MSLDSLTPTRLRAAVYRTDPDLAKIIDREDGCWRPTVGYGGCQDGNTSTAGSYGLCQADPGAKMVSAGADWATSVTTQLRWCRAYAVSTYGSQAAAWVYWQGHSAW